MGVSTGASGGRSNCNGISYKRYKQKYALLVFVPIVPVFPPIGAVFHNQEGFSGTFPFCTSFNQPLSNGNVSRVMD